MAVIKSCDIIALKVKISVQTNSAQILTKYKKNIFNQNFIKFSKFAFLLNTK